MKSNIYLWLISTFLFLAVVPSYACGPLEYHPYGYKMYRVFDKAPVEEPDERRENCVLWQKLTSQDIPLEAIEQVVYKYTLNQMKELMTVQDPNAFATWIRENNDKEIYDFLTLAKQCEYTRGSMNDPWYYPSKNDGAYMSLMEIEDKAKAYDGSRLKDRYVLQAVRAMFTARRFKECVEYWENVETSLPEGLIKEMSRSYLIGAYSRIGQTDYALRYFTDAKDLWSIIYCLKKQGKIKDKVDELECIATYAPDSHQVPEILQELVGSLEPWGSVDYTYIDRIDSTMISEYDKKLYDKLYDVSVRMSQINSPNKALWCYTVAFLADLDARPYEAWKYIHKAIQCPASEYLKESIRVMKIYLDAKVSVYDSAYEVRLLNDLRWLDSKIMNNITDKVYEITGDQYGSYLRINISYYYWNDMLRRILLGEVCPRMLDRGMPVRALQLANMADNILLGYCNCMDGKTLMEYRSNCSYNYIDYKSEFFWMMFQSVSTNELIAYVKRTQSATGQFDLFLNKRSFIDADYFNDVIGTRYLKEMDYSNAVRYLSKVSSSYQSRLNTEQYMNRNPFCITEEKQEIPQNYKLDFAKEMSHLEKSISSATDNSKKALDMIKYGTGIRNSFTYCWTLTDYRYIGWSAEDYSYINPILDKVGNIFSEALGLFDNEELAAAAHVHLCQWKTAVEKYPDTFAAKYTKISCDNLCDYSVNRVVKTTYTFYGDF